MDEWKKQYYKATVCANAINYFQEKFDAEGYYLRYQNYSYKDENKCAFMTSNTVGGFKQPSQEVRKWVFGVMDVIETKKTSLEIKGVWLMRSDTVDHFKAANDDANLYS